MKLPNESETQRALTALESISAWIQGIPTQEYAEKYRKALSLLYAAFRKTSKYQNQLRDGEPQDNATEDDLSDAWFKVAAELRRYDPDLAYRCEVKGRGWADQRVWNDPLYRDLPISLEAMLSEYFNGLERIGKHEDSLDRLKVAVSQVKFPAKEPLYERILRRLKDNKFVVAILLLVLVLGGVAKITGAISSIRDFFFPRKTILQISASIERYNFMAGRIEPVKSLAPVTRDIAQVKDAANDVLKEIVAAIGPIQNAFDVSLQIENHLLHASSPIRASVIVVTSQMAQVSRITHEIGETDNLDLAALSADPHLLNRQGNVIEIECGAPSAGLERVSLQVFKRGSDFSFSRANTDQRKVIHFAAHKIRLIVEKFDAHGDRIQNASLLLDSGLRQGLGSFSFFELSSETLESLKEERAHLEKQMQPGAAKSALATEHNADYIIAGTVASR